MDSPAPDGKERFLTAPMIAALVVSKHDQAERIEFPGYGVPDLAGFDPTPQNPNCGA